MSSHGGSRNPEHTVFGTLDLLASSPASATCLTPTVMFRSWQYTLWGDRRNADRDLFGGWSCQVFQVSSTGCQTHAKTAFVRLHVRFDSRIETATLAHLQAGYRQRNW